MPLTLSSAATRTEQEGDILVIQDKTDWTTATPQVRTNYALMISSQFFEEVGDTEAVSYLDPLDPVNVTEFNIDSPIDGSYLTQLWAFPVKTVFADELNLIVWNSATGELERYNGTAYESITFQSAVEDYQGGTQTAKEDPALSTPHLQHAYIFKNKLNLEYIQAVKYDIENGAQQNKLYYKRTDLDYVSSLISSAEYNWALMLYNNYYDIVANIKSIESTLILS